tara:strand:+ start:171 stop:551 length:381 start_codon:yes stop_codon:yes gene_type:complete
MLELLEKIRSRKILFLLLIAPLFFTPIRSISDFSRYEGLTIGPQLAFPIFNNRIGTIEWDVVGRGLDHPFDWRIGTASSRSVFVDWGRILYWECWVLLTYFVLIPNIKFKKIAGIWQGFKKWDSSG